VGIVLDTSILVAAERRRFDLAGWSRVHAGDEIAVSAITAAELLYGCERAAEATIRARRRAYVEAVLASVPVLPYTAGTARHHARVWAALAGLGTPIGAHDLIIAATALDAESSLATLNRREFERVPGLALAEVEGFEGS
jgi:tRNA(fMet)-specific endonuclease VapC